MDRISKSTPKLVFGTYRVKGQVLDIAIGQAVHAMTAAGIDRPVIDTALLYNNASNIQTSFRRFPNIQVGSKIHRRATVKDDVDMECQKYLEHGGLHRLLLHRYMPGLEPYMHLVRAKANGRVERIGVSNYTGTQLQELINLLHEADRSGLLPQALPLEHCLPDVVQNELHPFLRTSVPDVCRKYGIEFEAHSIFSHLERYPAELCAETGKTAAQLALAFAAQRGGGSIVFNTTNYTHLTENLSFDLLGQDVLAKLDRLKDTVGIHPRYPGSDHATVSLGVPRYVDPSNDWFERCDLDFIKTQVAPLIRADMEQLKLGMSPSETAASIPKFRNPASLPAHKALADAYFAVEENTSEAESSSGLSTVQRMEAVLHKLRQAIAKLRKEKKQEAATNPRTCKRGAVENPAALPVDIPDPTVLQPFIDLVRSCKELPETAIRMQCGTLFPDGRLDFCKQVAQPSFEELCEAVLTSGVIKHFLIGNNVVLADDTDGQREAALQQLITQSKGIVTWYLAGNAINSQQVKTVAEALSVQDDARFVWLKMNPIKTGSCHLGRMLRRNTEIELLDLFNTGQCDDGVSAFWDGLQDDASSAGAGASGLKHLYLDINAITCGATVGKVAALFPQLESLSLNVNRLGDSGCIGLLQHLEVAKLPLRVLTLGSNGLTDAIFPHLSSYVAATPTLTTLQLGSYRSTRFFQHQANSFTSSELMMSLGRYIRSNAVTALPPDAGYFGFQHSFSGSVATELSKDLEDLGLQVNGIQWNGTGHATPQQTGAESQSFTIPPVEYIQSVYRNAM